MWGLSRSNKRGSRCHKGSGEERGREAWGCRRCSHRHAQGLDGVLVQQLARLQPSLAGGGALRRRLLGRGRAHGRRATHGGRHARPAHSQGEESTFGKGADTRTETAGRGGGHRDSQLCCTAHRKPGGGMPGGGIIPGRNPGGGMPGGGMPGLQAARQRAGQRAQGTSAPHPKRDARIAQCPVTSERHDQLWLHTLLQQAEHTLLVLFSLLTPEAPPLSVTLRQATPLA